MFSRTVGSQNRIDALAQRLLESQRVLRTLFQNLPVMIYRRRLDADRSMEFVSHGCLALTGYQRADLTSGRVSYTSLIDAEDRQRVLDGIDAALHQRTAFDLTYCIRDAAGERR